MKRHCLAVFASTWLLALPTLADTTLVFNEIMYHPRTNEPALEWVEFHNQMAVDLDISNWFLTNGIFFKFPAGTVVKGGGYLVVASSPADLQAASPGLANVYGPFTNRLSNSGEQLDLCNNSGRVVASLSYGVDGGWPVAPDGSGLSLAKRAPDLGPAAKNWTVSEQIGGTPGAVNFPYAGLASITTQPITYNFQWKYTGSGSQPELTWREPIFDDTAWPRAQLVAARAIPNLFNSGISASGSALATGAKDPHFLLTASAQTFTVLPTNAIVMQNNSAWLANDTNSRWIGPVSSGSANSKAGAYNYQTKFALTNFLLKTVRLNLDLAVDNAVTNVYLNGVGTGLQASDFSAWSSFTLQDGFVAGTNVLDIGAFNLPPSDSPGGVRIRASGSGLAYTNSLPAGVTTRYFRANFAFLGDPATAVLQLRPIASDGAVFYLNGVEVLRLNMPDGPVTASTYALSPVADPNFAGSFTLKGTNLIAGSANVLAVELHQAAGSLNPPILAAELEIQADLMASPALAFNEIAGATNASFWLELFNYGTNALALGNHVLACYGTNNGEYTFPAEQTLGPGEFLTLTEATLGFHPRANDLLFLFGPARQSVIEAAVVKPKLRGRLPDATGPWRHPAQPTPGASNQFVLRDELVINEIMYHHHLMPDTNGLPQSSAEEWIELYNRSSQSVDLTGWRLNGAVLYEFPAGTTIASGAYLVVAAQASVLRQAYPGINIVGDFQGKLAGGDDPLVLEDPNDNPADEVQFHGSGRWPEYADGGGSSLELRDPQADNSQAEAWAASDETGKASWQSYSYQTVANFPSGTQPTQWNEFILGLLSDGECLIDDITVVESPTNSPVQMITNGNFENGRAGWRFVGTHRLSRVETDPENSANHVLRVIATGPQEHMHNHIEMTLASGRTIINGRIYKISFRAKWLAGNNLLNTRCYFNRVARTTALPRPALAGTPGARNSRYAGNIGPTFTDLGHYPVIPHPNQAVTVSVTAADPQNVASCALWYAVNGGNWNSVPMTPSPQLSTLNPQPSTSFTGSIPGAAAGAIVQFYVRAVDGLGAAATFPALGANSGALYMVEDGQANFARGHNFRLILSPANRSLLLALTNVMSNENLPGTVVYDETRPYYDIGIRLKGSERGRPNPTRISFHLTFQPDDLFRGVHPVMLIDRSGAGDATTDRQKEILIKHMLNREGGLPGVYSDLCYVIAPLSANTSSAILSPRHEDEFVATAFPNGSDGILYELELIYYPTSADAGGYKNPSGDSVLGVDIQNLGDDKELYRYNFIIHNHRDADDYRPFMAFAKTLGLSDAAALEARAPNVMDVNEWLRAWAHVTLCGVGDSYTFGNNHNLLMFSRPSDQKIVAFPVDMDFSFTRGSSDPLVGDQNLSRVISRPVNLRVFYAHILDIVDTVYNTAYMNSWITHYNSFVPDQSFASISSYIQARGSYAKSTINSAGGNTAFNIASSLINTASNLVTLSGTAPVQVSYLTVNGRTYPMTWSTISAWRLNLIVTDPTNLLVVEAFDLNGRPLANYTRTVTVNYTGPVANPEGAVVFNEIMYRPKAAGAEFVELYNNSDFAFDLAGWRVNGLDYTFPEGALLAGRQHLVLAQNPAAFLSAYTNAPSPFAQYAGRLDPDGETLSLYRPATNAAREVLVCQVRYEARAPWLASAAGEGASLELIDPDQDIRRPSNWGDGAGWRFISTNYTTGAQVVTNAYLVLDSAGELFLDELSLSATTGPLAGSNVLANGSFDAPLEGAWFFGTNCDQSVLSTEIKHDGPSGLRLVFTRSGVLHNTRASMWQPVSVEANIVYNLSFWYLPTTNANKLTFRVNSTFKPEVIVKPLSPYTPGWANLTLAPLPAYDPVWLNEVRGAGEDGPGWVELYNAGTNPVTLAGYYLADHYGTNLLQWAFPAGAALAPGEFKLVRADGTGASTPADWHANFTLGVASGQVALVRQVGEAAQVTDYLTYTNLVAGAAYGDFPDGQCVSRRVFLAPTPGAANLTPPAGVVINEWMASNRRTIENPDDPGHFDDWFELYNAGAGPADLSDYNLSNNLTNRSNSRLPAGTVLPAGGYLLVWADGANNPAGLLGLHADFKLSAGGEAIGLFGPAGELVDGVRFGPQTNDVSQGRWPNGQPGANYAWFTNATPGAANVYLGPTLNRPPAISPIADPYLIAGQSLTLALAASDPDAGQHLSWSLAGDPPAGLSVEPATGQLTWTPPADQAPGGYPVGVSVRDDGSPPLSASATFTVHVVAPPRAVLRPGGGGALALSFPTVAGKRYQVLYQDRLGQGPWLLWAEAVVGTGGELTVPLETGASPQRFYKLQILE